MDHDEQRPVKRRLQYRLKTLMLLPAVVGAGTYWYDWNRHRPPYKEYDYDGYMVACDIFVADLKAGRLDQAYESTSAKFKTQMSRKQFESLIYAFPLIRGWGDSVPDSYTFSGPEVDDRVPLSSWSEHQFTKRRWFDNRSIELWVWVVRDDSFFYRRPPPPRVEEIQIRDIDWPPSQSHQPLKPSWERE